VGIARKQRMWVAWKEITQIDNNQITTE